MNIGVIGAGTMGNGIAHAPVLGGFTVTNGYTEGEGGGGIYVGDSNLDINNIVINENISSEGAGIHTERSNVDIFNVFAMLVLKYFKLNSIN